MQQDGLTCIATALHHCHVPQKQLTRVLADVSQERPHPAAPAQKNQ